jgi:phosphoglycerol transferase MdoB-like AlkP superfamily enzyme
VIVIADHGHAQPGNSGESDPEKFKIPMLWFGPALQQKGEVQKLGNQTDLFSTLCRQLGDSVQLPPFSKNLLSDKSQEFAFFAFRNGCAFLNASSRTSTFDEKVENNAAGLFRMQAFKTVFQ